jgi:hypothetical protein
MQTIVPLVVGSLSFALTAARHGHPLGGLFCWRPQTDSRSKTPGPRDSFCTATTAALASSPGGLSVPVCTSPCFNLPQHLDPSRWTTL